MIRVALIGAGGMGRVHLRCYRNNPAAKLVALCDVAADKLRRDRSIPLRKDPANPDPLDLTGVGIHDHYEQVIARDDVDLIDICLPSPLHAPVAIAALRAGKHVFCEKPMAMTVAECDAMRQAQRDSGKQLVIGHSLRYMPQYVVAQRIISSGQLGAPHYARFDRSGGLPTGNYQNWLTNARESGGVVLDLHVHDIDIAHWWFGADRIIRAAGVRRRMLPVQVDTDWIYPDGLLVHLHAGWDVSSATPFRFAFQVIMEHGSVAYDSSIDNGSIRQYHESKPPIDIPYDDASPNQLQIDDILAALEESRPPLQGRSEDGAAAIAGAIASLEEIDKTFARTHAAG